MATNNNIDLGIIRNLIVRYGARENLCYQEICMAWHLLDHDWNGKSGVKGYSFPGELKLAERMGMKWNPKSKTGKKGVVKQVRKWIQRLEKKHLITVKRKPMEPIQYYYYGIIKKFLPYLEEEIGHSKKKIKVVNEYQGLIFSSENEEAKRPPMEAKRPPNGGQAASAVNEKITDNSQDNNSFEKVNGFPNSSKELFNRTLQYNTEEKSSIPQRYQMEFDHWKTEQGNRIFKIEFDEPPLWTGADAKEFARLRHDGKKLDEITERYEKYIRTENAWYAKNGYSFVVFAKNYAAFNGKIMSRQAETKGNGANGSTGDRTLDVYLSAMRGAKMADEMRRQANAKP